jgi:hypothetical protein
MKAIVPLDPAMPEGKSCTFNDDTFEIVGDREKVVMIQFHSLGPRIDWFDEFDLLYGERQEDPNVLKVIRAATYEDISTYRVPLWIQNEEVPMCCGKPMFFVGQIEDDKLCTESPPDAKLWWHDVARFYVFTCPNCLEVKAVGQQF